MIDLNQFGEHGPKQASKEDPVSAFLRAMSDNGIQCTDVIKADGKIHRFSPNGNKQKKNGWYVLHIDNNFPSGHFGDWSKGDEWIKWSSVEETKMSAEQIAIQRQREKRLRRQRQEEYNTTAQECNIVWESARPARSDFPYLQNKKVSSHGLKVHYEGFLLVPMFNNMGEIRSLQRIYPDGSKKHWPGGEAQGNYFIISGNQAECYICEGYATGATIHEATGGMVVVAFTRVNLPPVAESIKAKYPTSRITICADNDQWTDGNPGIKKAQEAGKNLGVKVVWPEFKDTSSKPTDFNDLASLEGIEQVKIQIKGKESNSRIVLSNWTCDLQFTRKAKPREWLVDETFPLGCCSILAAMGDSGKGFMMLDLCLSVAEPDKKLVSGGPQAFGHDVVAHGTAVYITAEDDHEEILRRLEGLDPSGDRRRAAGRNLIIVPLPNAGGPIPLVVNSKTGPEASIFFNEIRSQLLAMPDVKLVVFDPMASFIMADINEDPAAGAFTTGLMSSLAHETGANVQFCHHMKKADTSKGITPEKAREMVRGTGALVDGVRSVYALWPADFMFAQRVCRRMNVSFERNRVFNGAIIKSNGPSDRDIKTYVRNDSGLLVACDDTIRQISITQTELDALLIDSIAYAAKSGHPFTKTGANGIVKEQKHRIYKELQDLGEKKIRSMVDRLLEEKEIVMAAAKGEKTAKWLDVPDGKFAIGIGEFESGLGETIE